MSTTRAAAALPGEVDVVLLGCGITALSAAHQLASDGARCLVLDAYAEPGGNHKSFEIDGLEFDVGSIYFYAADRQFRTFPELRAACRPLRVGQAKVNRDGRLSRFPFDFRRDIAGAKKALVALSAAEAYGRRLLVGHGPDAASYVRSRIGSFLYRQSGLVDYLRRFFGVPPEELDVSFARHRLGWLTRRSSLRYQVRRQLGLDPRVEAARTALSRPPGGFAAYYGLAVERLRAMGVRVELAVDLEAVEKTPHGVVVRTASHGTVAARRLISTIPIPVAARLAGLDVPPLEHVRLVSLFVEAREPLASDALVIYNFDRIGRWKRLTVHSRMYTPGNGRTGFTVEIPVAPTAALPAHETVFAEFADHAAACGLSRSPLTLLGGTVLDYAYPLLSLGYEARRDEALRRLDAAGIESVGRQGRFDYIPTSTVAVRALQDFLAKG